MKEKIVLIQEKLLKDLKVRAITHNKELTNSNLGKEKKDKQIKLKLDVLALFVSLVNSIQCYYRDDSVENEGVVAMNATRMKKAYHDRYNDYITFLLEHKFLEKVSGGSAKAHKSSKYRISDNYYIDRVVGYKILDKKLLKKLSDNIYLDEIKEKKEFCEHKRPHLVKCFNESFTINKGAAFKEIALLNNKDTYSAYLKGLHSTLDVNLNSHIYSIDPQTDNRLHTTLTRTPKFLRKYIYYDLENIVGLDVKTSQVYFFCAIFKAILINDVSLLDRINATKVLDEKLVFNLLNLVINNDEVKGFVSGVLDQKEDFYEAFSKKIEIKYNKEGLPTRRESNYKSNHNRKKTITEAYSIVPYKSARALAKGAIMEIFYSSPETTISEAVVFRKEYPSITKIMKCIKDYGVPLWRLLDYVEAYCLLDYAALKFAEKHPDIFITSIHDCLVTTKSNIELLREEIEQYLMEVTTITVPPKFEVETWEEDIP
ncbi:hypothetical protein ACGK9U_06670 [Mariniflexile sp. HNIBRBA6329]|uniref:hypothetical protein n=1 Tax=Mariniflexile sp. HNIBRBA6329 TaxID=3373088 RepID=UPI0037469CA1